MRDVFIFSPSVSDVGHAPRHAMAPFARRNQEHGLADARLDTVSIDRPDKTKNTRYCRPVAEADRVRMPVMWSAACGCERVEPPGELIEILPQRPPNQLE